jgi:hypothetical protein
MSSIWVYGDSWVYGAGEPGWKDTLDKYTNGHQLIAHLVYKELIKRNFI